jgi:hypothetical protein
VKRTSFLAVFLSAIALFTTSCGTSDSMKSIMLSSTGASAGGFYNLVGVDGTLQLKVTAVYHSGKTIDVTNDATFAMVPTGTIYSSADSNFPANGPLPAPGPDTVTINKTGLMTGIAGVCTWVDLTDPSTGDPADPAAWAYTGYYQVTATYRNLTSQPVGIGMGIAESNYPKGGCGPS